MWKSVCCAIQGIGHRKKQIPCQDKTFALEQNGVSVIALAAGAGSASHSHFGAGTISTFFAGHFRECLACEDGRKVKQEIMQVLLQNLEAEAALRQCRLRDLASTLLVAAVCTGNSFLHISATV